MLNVSLTIIAVLLILSLFNVAVPTLGKSTAELKGESFCVVKNWVNEYVERPDIDSCCIEKKRFTLGCERSDTIINGNNLFWKCKTGNKVEYLFNEDGYKYCEKIV